MNIVKKSIIPRIAAIHDMSGFGRCSLSVIIPTLSSMGMQVCPLPTAVLSTHTGGFEGYTFVDLTDTMKDYYKHWKELGIDFDCIYSGFLGSAEQIDIIMSFIDDFGKEDTLVVVDPVFADSGRLYDTFSADFIGHMKRLVSHAHIITPNITEASFLLGCAFKDSYSREDVKKMLKDLCSLGPKTAVITSMVMEDAKNCVVAYDKEDERFWRVMCDYIPAEYPGTGDIFTSVLTGALLEGDSLPVAIDRAVNFVSIAIRTTFGYNTPVREGVVLEKVLHTLSKTPERIKYELL
ncbi:MAG: pyridoxamine kinase [Ruminococcaceae bacterium]|nr:pyridoxamine kinase [Oscillospiraceae bacterium]